MTTTKSFSEKHQFRFFYRKSLKQQFPFAVVATILFSMLIPMAFFMGFQNHVEAQWNAAARPLSDYYMQQFTSGIYLSNGQGAAVMVVVMLLALVAALINNSYMHSKKMTDLYHMLPIRRGDMLTANMLAAATTLLAPLLATYLVTMILQLVLYGQYFTALSGYFAYIALDLLGILLVAMVVYAFTTFIAVNVGTVFDCFALTGLVGIMPLFVYMITMVIWQSLTYGAIAMDMEVGLCLSPFTFAFYRYTFRHEINAQTNLLTPEAISGTLVICAIWLVIGAGLYAAARYRYTRRKSELAEQAQSTGVFQTMAKCFAAFCGGAIFYGIFYRSGSLLFWALAILLGSVVIGVIAELILSRGFRFLKKNLKWMLASGVLVCLLVFGSYMDIVGFVKRVPDAADVESVQVSYNGRLLQMGDIMQSNSIDSTMPTLTSPESIELITEIHKMMVSDVPPRVFRGNWEDTGDGYSYSYITLHYKLKNGKTISRMFDRIAVEPLVKMNELESHDDLMDAIYPLFLLDNLDMDIPGVDDVTDMVKNISVYNGYGMEKKLYALEKSEYRKLIDAIRLDMQAETMEQIANPAQGAQAYIEFQLTEMRYSARNEYIRLPTNCMTLVSPWYTNTLRVMEELGIDEAIKELPKVDKVWVMGAYAYDPYRIGMVTPGGVPDIVDEEEYFDGYHGAIKVEVTDAAQVKQIVDASRSQVLVGSERKAGEEHMRDYYYSDTVEVYLFSGGQVAGARLIKKSELPAPIREQVDESLSKLYRQYYPNEEGWEGELIEPEALPATVSVAVAAGQIEVRSMDAREQDILLTVPCGNGIPNKLHRLPLSP